MMLLRTLLPLLLVAVTPVGGFNYDLFKVKGVSLTDVETLIPDIKTIFVNEIMYVKATGVTWEVKEDGDDPGSDMLRWETYVGDQLQQTGTFNLSSLEDRELPDEIECGNLTVTDKGRHEIRVHLFIDSSNATASQEYEAFGAAAAIVPLLVVLILALMTQMVEFSLFFAIFVGACMVTGNVKDGFKTLLDDYILNALASVDHGYVYLFTLFLSGMVGMMEKSGGMLGFTRAIGKYAKTPRAGQCATFVIGIMIFFDDYANTLLAGETMRPLTDLLFVSREKLAFVVDATAAPVASLTPISSWVGFEVSLIQAEIERISKIVGPENLTIEDSGLAVFLQTIKYRYYPIFMLMLIPLLIFSKRDFGPMLIAERKTQVYERTDGGDGKGKGDNESMEAKENQPRPDTPQRSWNMLIPIILLVFFIFYLLVRTGDDGTGEQTFLNKIENSNSYSALLWGTMAAAILSGLMFLFQTVQDGELVLPTWPVIKALFFGMPDTNADEIEALNKDGAVVGGDIEKEEAGQDVVQVPELFSSRPRPLMSIFESVEAFLYGMGRIFPALIVLTLAWASGAIMIAVGADRLFSRWITGGVSAEALPTLSFIISAFMALATGTSWGTMTILFPLICLPTYQVSNGDPTIFYATVAGILSGSVAGDHVSPISDTTVLSSLASDCNLLSHVVTQAPYAIAMAILAILFGTLPIGRDAWPNIVGILLGALTIALFVYLLCAPVISPTGRFDIFTQLWVRYKGENSPLHKLQEDTIAAYEKSMGGVPDVTAEEPDYTKDSHPVPPEDMEGGVDMDGVDKEPKDDSEASGKPRWEAEISA
ncbi:Inherit from COG: Na H antiporter [Seminavis robusta]|uniref:Inherit from COG: Na H antiporter n=1 Tax=Seminavis robusta TaxID=568900 RepID=A0A9N8DAB9_9STRA|nr:Inherit from COG: Na H antiporter [Seminavis robusta]|eukprot:Sro58_g033760.1 Inherit from COG: Na H antiporter (823) ;mRNA; f:74271-77204